MKIKLFVILLTVAFIKQVNAFELSSYGYGPVKIGMTVQQAAKVLGVTFAVDEKPNRRCYQVKPLQGHRGIRFMVENGKISRVTLDDVDESGSISIKTVDGVGIGESEEKVKRIHKTRLEIKQHSYGGPADHYLTYWTSNKRQYGIRYEAWDGKITTIHSGGPSINLVEGCQ